MQYWFNTTIKWSFDIFQNPISKVRTLCNTVLYKFIIKLIA